MVFPAENRLGGRRFPLSDPLPLEDEAGNELGRILDVSLAGLRLATGRLLPLNRAQSVVLQAPTGPVHLRGTLVWARKGDAPGTFHMGMRFQRPSTEARAALKVLLDELTA